MSKKWLLSSTALTGVASAFMLGSPAMAADLYVSPPTRAVMSPTPTLDLPAVSSFNGKVEGLFGTDDGRSLALGGAAFSVPLSHRWGAQVGGFAGTVGGNTFLQGEGHLFWRDPSSALFGVYAAYSNLAGTGGLFTVAGESELYLNNFTVKGLLGYEFSQNQANIPSSLFADLRLAVYATKDLEFYGGYRYDQKISQAVVGGEWQLPLNTNTGVSVFGEGRFGSGTEAWGGLKLYFGQRKSLIDRHRQDDPDLVPIIPRTVQHTLVVSAS